MKPWSRSCLGARGRVTVAVVSATAAVALLAVVPASDATTRAVTVAPAPSSASADPGLAKLQRLATGARAAAPRPSSARRANVQAAANPATLTVTDPTGDVQPFPNTFAQNLLDRADLADTPTGANNAAGITVGATSITLSARIPKTANPTTDASWRTGDTGITWALSVGPTNPSGNIDFLANIAADKQGNMIGGVFTAPPAGVTPKVICYANAAWDGAATFSVSFPAACIQSPSNIQFYAQSVYDTTLGHDPNPQTDQPHDYAPGLTSPIFSGVVSPDTTQTPVAGGLIADKFGGVHPFAIGGGTPPLPRLSTLWPFDIVRGFAAFPDGGHGYVLDGRGGLFGVALGQNGLPVGPIGNAYWTWDIARGVAIMPDGTGGLVVDGWGGLHWFSIGEVHPAPAINSTVYWQGWDVARGVAILPDGTGGYVMDAWGGLHPFGLGSHTAPTPPPPTGGPYWKPWFIARGVTVLPDGSGGYIGDAWGVRHPFNLAGTPTATAGGPYDPGQDKERGPSVVWGTLPAP